MTAPDLIWSMVKRSGGNIGSPPSPSSSVPLPWRVPLIVALNSTSSNSKFGSRVVVTCKSDLKMTECFCHESCRIQCAEESLRLRFLAPKFKRPTWYWKTHKPARYTIVNPTYEVKETYCKSCNRTRPTIRSQIQPLLMPYYLQQSVMKIEPVIVLKDLRYF